MKIFKTDQSRTYIMFEDMIVHGRVIKCEGYFMQGVFMGTNIIDRRDVRGDDLETIRELLEGFFVVVQDDKIMEKIKRRFCEKCKR